MKRRTLASAPAQVWNEKNQGSDVKDSAMPMEELVEQVPLPVRRGAGVVILSALLLGAISLIWYFGRGD